jgi:hypothetical protein
LHVQYALSRWYEQHSFALVNRLKLGVHGVTPTILYSTAHVYSIAHVLRSKWKQLQLCKCVMFYVVDCTIHTHSTVLHLLVRKKFKISMTDSDNYLVSENGRCAVYVAQQLITPTK